MLMPLVAFGLDLLQGVQIKVAKIHFIDASAVLIGIMIRVKEKLNFLTLCYSTGLDIS
jgi:hypothetical protein